MSPVPAVNVRSSPPAFESSVPPKKISPVVTISELDVSDVATGPVALKEAAVITSGRPDPEFVLSANVSALETNKAPLIRPLAVIVASVKFPPEPLKDKLFKDWPALLVKSPCTLITALTAEVTRERLVEATSAEIPSANPVASITMPSAPVAVRVRVTPPSTTTESLILKKACVASALMLVEFPDPFTVKLPVPVIAPSILNAPAPPDWKSRVTALLLVHAAATVMAPILVAVLPSTTKSTDG